MYSVGPSLMFLDLKSVMSYQDCQPDADKDSTFKFFGSCSTTFGGDYQTTFLSDSTIYPQSSHPEWTSMESRCVEPFFPCDASLQQAPSPSRDVPYAFERTEDAAALWTWGTPCSSESPMFLENGTPFASASASPTSRSTYSYDDATPSPLQLNEFSNVFDFDFSASLPNDYFASEGTPSSLPSSISRRHSPRPLRNARSPDPRKSREPSPTNSETDAKRRFPCLVLGCARRFTSQYTLKVHMEAHKPKPRVSFPCTLGCSERFSRQHDRLRHEVAKHGKVCEFLCDDCGRFFSSGKTLGNHKCPVAQGGTRWVNNCS
ncbi:putative zinc finger [Lyophyllum shimeji]|uniref:Zinc finger n=1 Tax=Lyophyllum shimeji TaxID=47721 RepID=A0A9P3PWX3_LYOSH|nr:putative zinc finger [Lyophyllum shimeji]